MVTPSRKLTVSFGAFACTLEGFDDPFPVMRQVVDYFQALAAADPSFGAHPERPDTDYLKSLAQESAGGLVEAELSEGGMVLRQTSGEDLETTLDVAQEEIAEPKFEEEAEQDIEPAHALHSDEIMANLIGEQQFEDVRDGVDEELHSEDVNRSVEAIETADASEMLDQVLVAEAASDEPAPEIASAPELEDAPASEPEIAAEVGSEIEFATLEDLPGAGLPDWAQDLIDDDEAELEIASELETDTSEVEPEVAAQEDQIAQEEEALERVLKAAEERTQVMPELDRANPLSQLKNETAASAESMGEAVEASDVDDIFRAFAEIDTHNDPFAVDTAIEEIEDEVAVEESQAPTSVENTSIVTAAASTKIEAGSLRLNFEGELPRPAALQPSAPKPEAPADAPLVLKQEQRIEAETAATPTLMLVPEQQVPEQQVPEQQVSETQVDVQTDGIGHFAASAGAVSLPELLEASAAYVTLVSGRSTFSRRDIMGLIDEMSDDNEYSQEARIKSFGKLLRAGSILRTNDGQFAISDQALGGYGSKTGVA